MKVLSFDQATKCSGYSFWADGKLIDHGVVLIDDKRLSPMERIRTMRDLCLGVFDKYSPDVLCIEGVQFQNNQAVYGQLSQLQGALMTIAFDKDVALYVIPPSVWKSHCEIEGKKRIDQKINTINMVKELYKISVSEDIADAIGIGRYATEALILENKEN